MIEVVYRRFDDVVSHHTEYSVATITNTHLVLLSSREFVCKPRPRVLTSSELGVLQFFGQLPGKLCSRSSKSGCRTGT